MTSIFYVLRTLDMEQIIEKYNEVLNKISDGAEDLYPLLELYGELIKFGEEEGEIEYVEEAEEAYDPETHGRLFSKKIVELLDLLFAKENEINSITDVARKLNRDPANVYRDLLWLQQMGFVYLRRVGKRLIPRLLVLEYGIRFR